MDRITQSNAANAKESAAAAGELSTQAESLKEAVLDLRGLVDGENAGQGPAARPNSSGTGQQAGTTPVPWAEGTPSRSGIEKHARRPGPPRRRPAPAAAATAAFSWKERAE